MGKKNEKFNDYEAFVEKFKHKKTTDDCYTPTEVYDVVLEYVRAEYGIPEDTSIIRPFFPGGDYEHHNYPEGCVVLIILHSLSFPRFWISIAPTIFVSSCSLRH